MLKNTSRLILDLKLLIPYHNLVPLSKAFVIQDKNFHTSYIHCGEVKDPAPIFFSKTVQRLMRNITGYDIEKIFRAKKYETPLKSVKYQFLTSKELEKLEAEALKRGKSTLDPPPYLNSRSEPSKDICFEPELQGYEKHKLVFIDISPNVSAKNINVVVRESNGLLRTGSQEERARLARLYFPRDGQSPEIPQMFLGNNLNVPLNNEMYIYILDRACLQFEPDDPLYVETTRKVYNWIDERSHYNHLISTRHCGPMAFHFAWNKNIDGFLFYLLKSEMVNQAIDLIKLFYEVNMMEVEASGTHELIEKYIQGHSNNKGILQMCLKSLKDIETNKQNQMIGVRQAHGQN